VQGSGSGFWGFGFEIQDAYLVLLLILLLLGPGMKVVSRVLLIKGYRVGGLTV
jgi:hypothetical protein